MYEITKIEGQTHQMRKFVGESKEVLETTVRTKEKQARGAVKFSMQITYKNCPAIRKDFKNCKSSEESVAECDLVKGLISWRNLK